MVDIPRVKLDRLALLAHAHAHDAEESDLLSACNNVRALCRPLHIPERTM